MIEEENVNQGLAALHLEEYRDEDGRFDVEKYVTTLSAGQRLLTYDELSEIPEDKRRPETRGGIFLDWLSCHLDNGGFDVYPHNWDPERMIPVYEDRNLEDEYGNLLDGFYLAALYETEGAKAERGQFIDSILGLI